MNQSNWLSVGIGVLVGSVACGGTETLAEEEGIGRSHSLAGERVAEDRGVEHKTGLGGADADPMSSEKYEALVKTVGQEKASYLRAFQRNLAVYRHDLASGATATWAEFAPGRAGLVIVGQGEVPRLDIGEYQTVSEVFTALVPNEQVPDELVELEARRLEMAPTYQLMAEAAARFPELQEVREASPEEADPVDVAAGNAEDFMSAPLSPEFGQVGSAISGFECLHSVGYCGAPPSSAHWYITQKNRTAGVAIEKYDQESVGGVQCSNSGTILARAWYDLGLLYAEEDWYELYLPANYFVGAWFLQFNGGEEDFWFKMHIGDFQAGDVGSQCAYGYHD